MNGFLVTSNGTCEGHGFESFKSHSTLKKVSSSFKGVVVFSSAVFCQDDSVPPLVILLDSILVY